MDFRPEDIRLFLTRGFGLERETEANYLSTLLARTPRMQALATNPLLLSLIALVYEAQLELPDRRAELYKRCVEVLLTSGRDCQ
jgi:predicted NACHT family NTPase